LALSISVSRSKTGWYLMQASSARASPSSCATSPNRQYASPSSSSQSVSSFFQPVGVVGIQVAQQLEDTQSLGVGVLHGGRVARYDVTRTPGVR
jgi:hypothetical protein